MDPASFGVSRVTLGPWITGPEGGVTGPPGGTAWDAEVPSVVAGALGSWTSGCDRAVGAGTWPGAVGGALGWARSGVVVLAASFWRA